MTSSNTKVTLDELQTLFGFIENKSVLNVTEIAKNSNTSEKKVLDAIRFRYETLRADGELWAVINLDKPITKHSIQKPKPYFDGIGFASYDQSWFHKDMTTGVWYEYENWFEILQDCEHRVPLGDDQSIVTAKLKHVGKRQAKFGHIRDYQNIRQTYRDQVANVTIICNNRVYNELPAFAEPGDLITIQVTLNIGKDFVGVYTPDIWLDYTKAEPVAVHDSLPFAVETI